MYNGVSFSKLNPVTPLKTVVYTRTSRKLALSLFSLFPAFSRFEERRAAKELM
jgi:hypothetical protein